MSPSVKLRFIDVFLIFSEWSSAAGRNVTYQTLAAHTVLVAEIKSLTVFSLGFVDDKKNVEYNLLLYFILNRLWLMNVSQLNEHELYIHHIWSKAEIIFLNDSDAHPTSLVKDKD